MLTHSGNAPKTRPSDLTTSDTVNEVFLKDSPSKTLKASPSEDANPELRLSRCLWPFLIAGLINVDYSLSVRLSHKTTFLKF